MPTLAIDSILTSIKKMLGIDESYTAYDLDITIHINSVFSTLQQLGVGLTDDQFLVVDADQTWDDALTTQRNLNMIKSYMVLRIRQMFDPAATGFVTTSFENQIKEYEWRIAVAASSTPNRAATPGEPVEPGTPTDPNATVWNLTGLTEFPAGAAIGDIGIDYISGDVWRKTA